MEADTLRKTEGTYTSNRDVRVAVSSHGEIHIWNSQTNFIKSFNILSGD